MYLPDRRARRVVPPLYAEAPAPSQPREKQSLAERCAELKLRQQAASPAKVVVEGPRIVMGNLPDPPDCPAQVQDVLAWMWSWRPCLVCKHLGPCAHRQPDDDIAQLVEWYQALKEATK